MENDWNKRWDFIPQVTGPMGGSSILAGITAMISNLRIDFLKFFEAYAAFFRSIEFSPFFTS